MDKETKKFIEEQNSQLASTVKAGFDAVDKRFESVDKRFDEIDKRFDLQDQRIDELEHNMDVQFRDVRRDIEELKKISIPMNEHQDMLRRIGALEEKIA
jgi:hypothetical protein